MNLVLMKIIFPMGLSAKMGKLTFGTPKSPQNYSYSHFVTHRLSIFWDTLMYAHLPTNTYFENLLTMKQQI